METDTYLRGLYTAIVTPFTEDGAVDEQAFTALLEYQIQGNVQGVVVCGTTGESPTVTEKEFFALFKLAKKMAPNGFQIIAGTGSNNTQHVIERSKAAADLGADALLLAAPYYNKPSQKGLIAHYHAIADSVDLPQIIYNVPGRTAVNILPDTLAVLARHPNIKAVKEACGDINQIMDVIKAVPNDFAVLAGDDAISLPTIAAGGCGVISVISNEAPAQMSAMVQHALRGDFRAARQDFYALLPLMKANFWESNPMIVKAALAEMGIIKNVLRLPLVPMDTKFQDPLRNILRQLGLLQH